MSHSIPNQSASKTCKTCGESKPTSEFSRHPTTRDKLQPSCKPCAAENIRAWRKAHPGYSAEKSRAFHEANPEYKAKYNRAYREKNRERLDEYNRTWYVVNKEHLAEYKRAWVKANRDRVAMRSRAYYEANRERKIEQARAWASANRAKVNDVGRRYRAQKAKAEGTHTAADVELQYKRQKGKCYYCHVKVNDSYHVDHIVPISRGGSDGPENLVVACPSCNTSKHDKLPHEWIRGGRLL